MQPPHLVRLIFNNKLPNPVIANLFMFSYHKVLTWSKLATTLRRQAKSSVSIDWDKMSLNLDDVTDLL